MEEVTYTWFNSKSGFAIRDQLIVFIKEISDRCILDSIEFVIFQLELDISKEGTFMQNALAIHPPGEFRAYKRSPLLFEP